MFGVEKIIFYHTVVVMSQSRGIVKLIVRCPVLNKLLRTKITVIVSGGYCFSICFGQSE